MSRFSRDYDHYCRWCNKLFKSKKPNPYSGFCCAAHKQAHHRAYKKYVTGIAHVETKTRPGSSSRK